MYLAVLLVYERIPDFLLSKKINTKPLVIKCINNTDRRNDKTELLSFYYVLYLY